MPEVSNKVTRELQPNWEETEKFAKDLNQILAEKTASSVN